MMKSILTLVIVNFFLIFSCMKSVEDYSFKNTNYILHKIEMDSNINFASVTKKEKQKNILVVFLTGTDGKPKGYRMLLEEILNEGFHVIALDYPNKISVGSIAKNNLESWEKIREKIVTGNNTTDLVSLKKEQAIIPMLTFILKDLAKKYPYENWSKFLDAGSNINWNNIITSGFSQGAGHSAYIASQYSIYGAILFSGPVDGRIEKPFEAAYWIKKKWKTDKSKIHIMLNKNDPFYEQIKKNVLEIVKIENKNNLIITSDVSKDFAHSSTCEDISTPKNIDGSPKYKLYWEKLMRF